MEPTKNLQFSKIVIFQTFLFSNDTSLKYDFIEIVVRAL